MHWLFMLMLFRTGTILFGKGIMLRTFVLLVYFFVATQLTHQQLIHEVDLEWDDVAGYQLSTGTKTSTATTVFYHKIFRLDIVTRWVIMINKQVHHLVSWCSLVIVDGELLVAASHVHHKCHKCSLSQHVILNY